MTSYTAFVKVSFNRTRLTAISPTANFDRFEPRVRFFSINSQFSKLDFKMALTDHIAILTHHSLAAATPNKLKAGNPLEFYALIALPPEAGTDLQAIAEQAANGAPLANFEIGITTNAKAKTPIPGIPADWFVVRAATQFAPFVADHAGEQLEQSNPEHAGKIKSTFYAGKRIRSALTAYAWNFKGKIGISFNLAGVMDAGQDGERLAIGNGVVANAFKQHATAPAAQPALGGQVQVANTAPTGGANPFAQAAPAAAANANPFAAQA